MRICPTCRAEINEYNATCDYCGTELPINEEFNLAIKNAEIILYEAEKLKQDSYKLKKYDLDIINRLTLQKKYLEDKYSESDLAISKILEINKTINFLEEKIKIFKRIQYRKTIRNTILIATFTEILLFILCSLVLLFNPEDVETFVVGLPALFGLFIGLGLCAESSALGGSTVGMICGGLIGMIIFWLISTPFGQLIILLVGTISVIVGIIFGIKKAKKIWL